MFDPVREQPVVERQSAFDVAVEDQLALLEHADAPADRRTAAGACETKMIVLPSLHEPLHRLDAPLLEVGVADGEDLVEQQDVRIEVRRDRKAQPHVHARRVVLDRHVDEVLEPGVLDDARRRWLRSRRPVRPWIAAFRNTFSRPVSSG